MQWCPAFQASWKTARPRAPPPPLDLLELEAARKPRPGGSTARPGQVPAASRPCSSSVWPSHASCREKHTPCLTPGRSPPSAQCQHHCATCSGGHRGGQGARLVPRQLSAWHRLTVESGEYYSQKGEQEGRLFCWEKHGKLCGGDDI